MQAKETLVLVLQPEIVSLDKYFFLKFVPSKLTQAVASFYSGDDSFVSQLG
jgi:hypothetical protein